MTAYELCTLTTEWMLDAEATASNSVYGPIVDSSTAALPVAVILEQGARWLDRPHGSICRLAAIAPLFVAAPMAPPANH